MDLTLAIQLVAAAIFGLALGKLTRKLFGF